MIYPYTIIYSYMNRFRLHTLPLTEKINSVSIKGLPILSYVVDSLKYALVQSLPVSKRINPHRF